MTLIDPEGIFSVPYLPRSCSRFNITILEILPTIPTTRISWFFDNLKAIVEATLKKTKQSRTQLKR